MAEIPSGIKNPELIGKRFNRDVEKVKSFTEKLQTPEGRAEVTKKTVEAASAVAGLKIPIPFTDPLEITTLGAEVMKARNFAKKHGKPVGEYLHSRFGTVVKEQATAFADKISAADALVSYLGNKNLTETIKADAANLGELLSSKVVGDNQSSLNVEQLFSTLLGNPHLFPDKDLRGQIKKIEIYARAATELTLRGKYMVNLKNIPDAYNQLFVQYMHKLLVQKNLDATDNANNESRSDEYRNLSRETNYVNFLSRFPYITFNNFQIGRRLVDHNIVAEETTFGSLLSQNIKKTTVERISSANQNITIVDASEKSGFNSLGLWNRPDGVTNIALACGSKESALPEVASRAAVQSALSQMKDGQVSLNTLLDAYSTLGTVNIPELGNDYVNLLYARGENGRAAAVMSKIVSGNELVTSLTTAQYDQRNNRLRIALKGMSPVIIVHTDGRIDSYQSPIDEDGNPSMLNGSRNNSQIDKNTGNVIGIVPLEPDDIVIIAGSGLNLENFKGKMNRLNRKATNPRKDVVYAEFFKSNYASLVDSEVDDFSAVIIHHQQAA